MAASQSDRNALARASEEQIRQSARRIGGYATDRRWLSRANRYQRDVVARLTADDRAASISSRQLSDYIAASAPLHCCDGWALLGRALGCHLHGDGQVARHLAYYAELRAAMSLLATQGIGIFDDRHFAIDEKGSAHRVSRKRTHQVAWDLLEAWAELKKAADVLGEVLQPNGRSMHEWLQALPQGVSWRPIATDWLKWVGLDLQVLGSDDRGARNEASYRPAHLRCRSQLPSVDAAEAVRDLWGLLEPAPPLAFAELDRHLLRRTLETSFYSVQGKIATQLPAVYGRQVETAVRAGAGGDTPQADAWIGFLRREQQPQDPAILKLADEKPQTDRPDYHLSMMARALLLLRVASGATRRLLIDAGLDLEDLAFWWQPYGEGLGLWDEPPSAAQLTDGWADAEAVLEELESLIHAQEASTYHRIAERLPECFARLTRLEMVGVWSLAA